ncbi:MAG: YbgA family protein [Nitrosopumilus sp.]
MSDFSRPIIGISKCLEFDMCRYDGSRINNNFVRNMKKYVDFVDICPEVGIGLGTPRKPIRLVKIDGKKNLYQPSSDRNLTDEMHNFTKKFVASIEVLDGFIFKRDSPTCGITDVRLYHKLGTDSGYQKTSGMFSEGVSAEFPNMVKEDEKRLSNISIREHFLTRIFVLANLRESLKQQSMEKLFEFYSKNMLLFLCHDEKLTAELGLLFRIQDDFAIISKKFQKIAYDALSFPVKKAPMINTFEYMYNFVKLKLSESEQSHYQSLIDKFENDLISQSEISTLLYSWALRYDVKIILEQSLFDPFPKNLLLDLVESKKEYSVL